MPWSSWQQTRKIRPGSWACWGSLTSFACVVATVVVLLLAERWGYRVLFMVVGALVIVGGLISLPLGASSNGLPPSRRVILRRRYWLYYALSFLLGSRRHIFTTFAILLLVREHGISIHTTAILYLVNSVVSIFSMRVVGQMVGRLGERLVMTITFAALALVFMGYACTTYLPLLFLLFVLDNVLFGFNIALTTYFQKIAVDPEGDHEQPGSRAGHQPHRRRRGAGDRRHGVGAVRRPGAVPRRGGDRARRVGAGSADTYRAEARGRSGSLTW